MSITATSPKHAGPTITSANFSLVIPRTAFEDGDLVLTCDVPECSPQADLYKTLTIPIGPMGELAVHIDEEHADKEGCTDYTALIKPAASNLMVEARISLVAAAKRLREILDKGKLTGSNAFLPVWQSILLAFRKFNEELYYAIVVKECANIAKIFPQANHSVGMAFNSRPTQESLPSKITEHSQCRKAWERKTSLYGAVMTAGESLESLFDLVPNIASTMDEPSEDVPGSVFELASNRLSSIKSLGPFYTGQIRRDIEFLKRLRRPELFGGQGQANAEALRERLLSNPVEVCELSTEYEEGNMDTNLYVEKLFAIGKPAQPGDFNTEMPDAGTIDSVSAAATTCK